MRNQNSRLVRKPKPRAFGGGHEWSMFGAHGHTAAYTHTRRACLRRFLMTPHSVTLRRCLFEGAFEIICIFNDSTAARMNSCKASSSGKGSTQSHASFPQSPRPGGQHRCRPCVTDIYATALSQTSTGDRWYLTRPSSSCRHECAGSPRDPPPVPWRQWQCRRPTGTFAQRAGCLRG